MLTETVALPVDVTALARSLRCDAAATIAKTVQYAVEWFDEHACPLTETQKTALMRAAIVSAEDLETRFAETLMTALAASGIETLG